MPKNTPSRELNTPPELQLPAWAFSGEFQLRTMPFGEEESVCFERAILVDEDGLHVVLRESRLSGQPRVLNRLCESVVDACLREMQWLWGLRGPVSFYHLSYAHLGGSVAWQLQQVVPIMREGQAVFVRWLPLSSARQGQLIEALSLATSPPSRLR